MMFPAQKRMRSSGTDETVTATQPLANLVQLERELRLYILLSFS